MMAEILSCQSGDRAAFTKSLPKKLGARERLACRPDCRLMPLIGPLSERRRQLVKAPITLVAAYPVGDQSVELRIVILNIPTGLSL
jgi:hypothetical protein